MTDWSDFSLLSLHFKILKGRIWSGFLHEVKHKAALKLHASSIKGLSGLAGLHFFRERRDGSGHSSSQSTLIESKDGGDRSRRRTDLILESFVFSFCSYWSELLCRVKNTAGRKTMIHTLLQTLFHHTYLFILMSAKQ